MTRCWRVPLLVQLPFTNSETDIGGAYALHWERDGQRGPRDDSRPCLLPLVYCMVIMNWGSVGDKLIVIVLHMIQCQHISDYRFYSDTKRDDVLRIREVERLHIQSVAREDTNRLLIDRR
jgi:hypothetical protein